MSDGAAGVGAVWSSRGRIPVHRRQFDDASRVTVADRSHCFEYVTQSRIKRSHRGVGRSRRQLIVGVTDTHQPDPV